MIRPSGQATVELLLFSIACETISEEKRDTELSSGHSLKSFLDNSGGGVARVWDSGDILFSKRCCYFSVTSD